MEILGGPIFGVAGAGESHGPAISTIVFGCPPGVAIARQDIQRFLDRRRPGGNKHGTPRNEKDQVALLSGIYQPDHEALLHGPSISLNLGEGVEFTTETYDRGWTTGEPISAVVLSTSKKSGDYGQFVGTTGEVRPGHTDLVKHYQSKGFVDPRGGGRSSYRCTISDVIGGSIAKICLQANFNTIILSSICQVGPLTAQRTLSQFANEMDDPSSIDSDVLQNLEAEMLSHEIHSLDSAFANQAAELIMQTRKQGDSIGASIEVVAFNVPPLAGSPLYQSLKLRLMGSLGGLHAVRSCEIGAGADVVFRTGSENNDSIRTPGYQSNNHGGLLGGITTSMPLVLKVGFKPTSTINKPQKSVRKNMEEIDFELKKGRHDPCVGVRAGVTLESRLAIELQNAVLQQQAVWIEPDRFNIGES